MEESQRNRKKTPPLLPTDTFMTSFIGLKAESVKDYGGLTEGEGQEEDHGAVTL